MIEAKCRQCVWATEKTRDWVVCQYEKRWYRVIFPELVDRQDGMPFWCPLRNDAKGLETVGKNYK